MADSKKVFIHPQYWIGGNVTLYTVENPLPDSGTVKVYTFNGTAYGEFHVLNGELCRVSGVGGAPLPDHVEHRSLLWSLLHYQPRLMGYFLNGTLWRGMINQYLR